MIIALHNRQARQIFLLAVCLCIQLFFCFSISPLYQFEGYDVVIFKQMADVILKGGTPYLDLNDNKGVLLYALYAVGQSIPNSKVGVFLICAVLFYISVFYWSKISQLLLPQSNQRWMVLWIGICFYTILQKLGGLTEDICLPICSYALYIGIRMVYTNQPLSKRHSFVLGLLFAILVFIRLNNIAYVIAPLLWAGGRKLKEKKRQEIPSLIGFFLLGGISVAFVIYGVMYGCYGWTGIASMTNSMFLSLLRYQGLDYTPDLLLQTVNIGIQLLFFGAALMFIKGMKASERMVLRFAFVLSILNMVCLGKHFYSHYFILFVPLYFLLACLFTKYANTTIRSALILLLLFPFAYKTHNVCRMLICEDQIHEEEFYRATDEMVNVIPMEDRNQVFNYGYTFSILEVLHRNGIVPCNNQPLEMDQNADFKQDQAEYIKSKWVIITEDKYRSIQADSLWKSDFRIVSAAKFKNTQENLYVLKNIK